MSIETWIAEFYPVPTNNAEVQQSDINRLDHSIRKWKGLLPENLEKHDVAFINNGQIVDKKTMERQFVASGDDCALCEAHYDTEGEDDEGRLQDCCFTCPLSQQGNRCEKPGSVYSLAKQGQVHLMVEALEKALHRIGDEIADAKYLAQQLDGAESDEERNDILRSAHP